MSAAPVRLQLSRAKGFDLQRHSLATNGLPALNIARPGPLGNPFIVGEDGDRRECVHLCRMLLAGHVAVSTRATPESQRRLLTYVAEHLKVLRNRNVACWCPANAECHGDPMLELFNRRSTRGPAPMV